MDTDLISFKVVVAGVEGLLLAIDRKVPPPAAAIVLLALIGYILYAPAGSPDLKDGNLHHLSKFYLYWK